MKRLFASLKARILYPLIIEPIKMEKDFVRRIISLAIAVICFVGGLIIAIVVPKDHVLAIWTWWGLFCGFPFLPRILKSSFRSGKIGYEAGKSLTEEEYYEINHVGGGQFRATHHKDNNGMFFGIVSGIIAFMIIMLGYEIIGPILLGIRIYKLIKLIIDYKKNLLVKSESVTNI